MEATKILRAVILVLCLLPVAGCSLIKGSAAPAGVFPDYAGDFKERGPEARTTNYIAEKNRSRTYQTWQTVYGGGEATVMYTVGEHASATDAAGELAYLTECFDSDLKPKPNTILTEDLPVKDKSGNDVGKAAVCLQPKPGTADGLGPFDLRVSLNDGSRTHKFVSNAQDQSIVLRLIRALPVASQLDLSILERFSSVNERLEFAPLFKQMPPEKLGPQPQLKGNILVLEKKPLDDNTTTDFIFDASDVYVGQPSRRALVAGDIGTLVLIACGQGKKLGIYDTGSLKIPAFSGVCDVFFIDRAIPAVVGKKSFTSTELPDSTLLDVKDGKAKFDKFIAPFPFDDVKAYLDSLQK